MPAVLIPYSLRNLSLTVITDVRQGQLFLGVTFRLTRQHTTCAGCLSDHNHSVCVLCLFAEPAVPTLLSVANSTNTNPNNGKKATAKTTAVKAALRFGYPLSPVTYQYHTIPGPIEKDPTSCCGWRTRHLFDPKRRDTQQQQQQQQAAVATTVVATVVVRIVAAQRTACVPRKATHSSFGYPPGCYQEKKTSTSFATAAVTYQAHVARTYSVYRLVPGSR